MQKSATSKVVAKSALVLSAIAFSVCIRGVYAEPSPCAADSSAHVAVDLGSHRLFLCQAGKPHGASFDIRIGHNGAGKQKEGDGKTPTGTYAVGPMRTSKRYGWFIPIGYPTEDQKRRGLTGGSVGIHGPDRRVAWLGGMVNWFDTTDGCVGLASDEEVMAIGRWIKRTNARQIRLF